VAQANAQHNADYSFEVRFGPAAISEGVVPIPRIVLDHYAHLGMKDREMMLVIHLLAYKWTRANPFPKRRRLNLSAGPDSRRRSVSRMRKLGLLFTSRVYRHGRMACLIYDLDSLLHNAVRIHTAIETVVTAYIVQYGLGDPDDREVRKVVKETQPALAEAVVDSFEIELPDNVMARLVAGEYHDVPEPWADLIEEKAPVKTVTDDLPPPPPDLQGQALLDYYFEPRQERLDLQPPTPAQGDWATPAQVKGDDSRALAVLDLVCQFNGLSGADVLPAGQRVGWLRHIHEIFGQWGNPTLEQARLAMQAWTIRYRWRKTCNPFYNSWPNEFGMLLIAVREGSITIDSLRQEEEEEKRRETARRQREGRPPDRAAYAKYAQGVGHLADPEGRPQQSPELQKPEFWKRILAELKLQMTEATYLTWLHQTTARTEDGMVVVVAHNEYAVDWLEHRLLDIIRRTARRILDNEEIDVIIEEAPGDEQV
jgi:hypothetical protein